MTAQTSVSYSYPGLLLQVRGPQIQAEWAEEDCSCSIRPLLLRQLPYK
jgi:hypothetical protein